MSTDEFGGLAEHVRVLRDGQTSSEELVTSAHRAHRGQPAHHQRLPLGARRTRRSTKPGTPTGGSPRGSGCRCSACRSPSRTTPMWPGCPRSSAAAANSPPADRGRRGGTPAPRGRRRDRRQDQLLRARPVAVHRGPGLRRHPQPLVHRPHPGRLLRRLRGRRRRRARARGARLGRRGLGPHPGRLDPSRRHQAAARPGLPPPLRRRLPGPRRQRPARPHRRRRRPAARRGRRARTPRTCTGRAAIDASAAARRDPGRLRIALAWRPPLTLTRTMPHPEVRRAVTALAEALARLGHHVEEARPRYGLIGLAFVPRATAGIAEVAALHPDPALLDPRTRSAMRTRPTLGGRVVRAARAREARQHRRIGAIFDTVRRACSPRRPPRRRRASAPSTA